VTRERFTGADAAWLRMERPHSPMVIVGFFELDRPIDVDTVRSIIEERLLVYERFRQRVEENGRGRPWWVEDEQFDIAHHVFRARIVEPVGPRAFNTYVDHLASASFLGDRPMWEMHVVERLGRGSAIVAKLHHSIADGIALMQVLLSICDDVEPTAREHRRRHRWGRVGAGVEVIGREAWQVARRPRRLAELAGEAIGFAGATARLALLPPDPRTSLKSPLSGVKRTSWSEPIPLDRLRDIGRPLRATVNDVMLTAMSGALRDHLLEQGERLHRDVRAMVPFNLRPPEVGRPLGNRFGLVLPALPVGLDDPIARLHRVQERMAQIKDTPEASAAFSILTVMGLSGWAVESLLVRFFGTKSSAVMTNVPGPSERLRFAGRRVERIMFWVPQAGGIGLGVSLLSYAGSVTVGILGDTALLEDPTELVARFYDELDVLGALVAG
jgi:diacylglycerol O-acyltransferase / wax synthase